MRRGFTARDGSSHTLYFQGTGPSARLKIHSNDENDVERFLNEYEGEGNVAGARLAYREMMERINRMSNEVGRADPGTRASVIPQLEEEIQQKQNDLVEALGTMNIEGLNALRLAPTHIEFGPAAGAEKRGVAEPLTQIPGNTVGSPTHGDHLVAERNELRNRNADFTGGNLMLMWIQMHLISHRLHGPASAPNLVMAPQGVNSSFESRVESDAVSAISRGTPLFYKVKAEMHPANPQNDQHFVQKIFYAKKELGMQDAERVGTDRWRVVSEPAYTQFGGDLAVPPGSISPAARALIGQIPGVVAGIGSQTTFGIDVNDLRLREITIALLDEGLSGSAINGHVNTAGLPGWRSDHVGSSSSRRTTANNRSLLGLTAQVTRIINNLKHSLASYQGQSAKETERMNLLQGVAAQLRGLGLGQTHIMYVFNENSVPDRTGQPKSDWTTGMQPIR